MENKQTAPKEIWVNLDGMTSYNLSKTEGKTKLNPINGQWLNYDTKYIHSSEVERLLAEKDAEIEALRTKLQIRENLNRNANREDI